MPRSTHTPRTNTHATDFKIRSDSRLRCYYSYKVTLQHNHQPNHYQPPLVRIVVPPSPLHTSPAPTSHRTLRLLLALQPTGPQTPRLYCVPTTRPGPHACPPPHPGSHGCGLQDLPEVPTVSPRSGVARRMQQGNVQYGLTFVHSACVGWGLNLKVGSYLSST